LFASPRRLLEDDGHCADHVGDEVVEHGHHHRGERPERHQDGPAGHRRPQHLAGLAPELVGGALVVSLLLAVPFAAVTLARPAADQLRGGVNR
jgi:hypothetical protein